ncbi:hypothetical protein ACFQX6_65995 [Streptosporangium lutulentum]
MFFKPVVDGLLVVTGLMVDAHCSPSLVMRCWAVARRAFFRLALTAFGVMRSCSAISEGCNR